MSEHQSCCKAHYRFVLFVVLELKQRKQYNKIKEDAKTQGEGRVVLGANKNQSLEAELEVDQKYPTDSARSNKDFEDLGRVQDKKSIFALVVLLFEFLLNLFFSLSFEFT